MIGHEIITASAGAGKTWSLTLRYIRLLAMGADPASIIALTFSRKAAGEFFTAILHRLAGAAAGEVAATRLANDAGMPELHRRDFTRLLASLIQAMPSLTLGTMDSFFIRIARSFPLELGLAGDFTILDDHRRSLEQQRVLARVFAPGSLNESARRDFMHAFQQATWGKDEVRLKRLLEEFLGDWQSLYLSAPSPHLWGNAAAIWPEGSPFQKGEASLTELIAGTRFALTRSEDLKDSQKATLDSLLSAMESTTPGTPLLAAEKRTLGKLLDQLTDLARGSIEITLRTKVTLRPPLTDHLHAVLQRFVRDTIAVCLHQTKGIHGILSLYDGNYHEMVRRQGRLTFQDVQFILSGGMGAAGPESPATGLKQTERESIDYRLDARYDHWLLDEFQDTSRVQWRILQNLCDEVIQDAGGGRTFFAVGDEKQSIFTWRGAEPGLFDEILRHYNQGAELIKVRPLALSQRSGPAVISMVNRLCGNIPRLSELEKISGAAAQWPWQSHTSAHPERTGCGAVIEIPVEKADGEDATTVVWETCGALLRQLRPLQRGLSCAVILHRNARASECADVLRLASGMEVVCESDVSIASDNPASSALLSLLKAAAHPGDQFSWQQAMMSPFQHLIESQLPPQQGRTVHQRNAALRPAFTLELLRQVSSEGFEFTLRHWQKRLCAHLPGLDPFSRARLADLCRAAQEFDATGSRDIDEFLAFVDNWTVRESAHSRAIQVMTLHKSKGLTFDIVILPDLHDGHMYNRRNSVGIGRDEQGAVSWLTTLPSRDIATAEPVISKAIEDMEAAQWRERIAQLYVAVTRAKRANYILLPPAPEKVSDSINLPRIVRHMLGGGLHDEVTIGSRQCTVISLDGDPRWIDAVPLPKPPGKPGMDDLFAQLDAGGVPAVPTVPGRRAKKRPSTPARALEGRRGRQHGNFVHEWFRRVEWLTPETINSLTASFARLFPQPEAWQRTAFEVVQRCLEQPASATAFTPPGPGAAVWRERPFEVEIDDAAVSGIFDRVIVERDPTGQPVRATLIEFKTDHIERDGDLPKAIERHTAQTTLYTKALQQLTGLPSSGIRASFLFTAIPELRPCQLPD